MENVPTPPLSNTPIDSTPSSGKRVSSDNANIDYEVIDFQFFTDNIDMAAGYVQETRSELDPGNSEQWITDLLQQLDDAKKAVRDFEILHAEDTIEWENASGEMREVLHKSQDEEGFNNVVGLFTAVMTEFDVYFDKHVAWLEEHL